MRVTIHQPEHMPWLGFFHKINMADVYVVLDNVQYRRRYFQNRNKIRTKEGWQWLNISLKKEPRDSLLIKNVSISDEGLRWRTKNLNTIYHNYCKAKYFKYYWEEFKLIYSRNCTSLLDLNMELLKFFFRKLDIKTRIQLASALNVSGTKGELILNICKALKARIYISGVSGKDYLDFQKFNDNHIEIIIQEFHHPIYTQLYEPFIPCMSIIDLLFNYGDKSLDIINGKNVSVMKEVFI